MEQIPDPNKYTTTNRRHGANQAGWFEGARTTQMATLNVAEQIWLTQRTTGSQVEHLHQGFQESSKDPQQDRENPISLNTVWGIESNTAHDCVMLVEMWLKGADMITSSLWSNTERWNPNGYGQTNHVVYNLLMDFSAIHIFSDCHPRELKFDKH